MPIILLFFVGMFAGLIVGLIVGKSKDFEWGIGTGCLIMGMVGLGVSTYAGIHRYYELKGTVKTIGTLVDYLETKETSADVETDKSYEVTYYIPIVRFSTPDGNTYTIRGLGGSKKWQIKDDIDILYKPSNPEKGFIADFQNTWALTCVLLLFSSFPLLVGFFFIGEKIWD
ncbi:PF12158 family protein [Leptospira interrogans str. 2006001854]|uniref:PF12158 family protein n=1 Tax=Leptospira interrogans str. 2006001854 TaxID=1001590 RepID=M6GK75_LEPIR|nr:PF12158 family protein [Leptospira interrogans str. 2006001854]